MLKKLVGAALCLLPMTQTSLANPDCPESLNAAPSWFVTSDFDPTVKTSAKLRMRFVNNGPAQEIRHDQIWSVPSVVTPDVIVESEPVGIVETGEKFKITIIVDLTDLPEGDTALAIRPRGTVTGNVMPSIASIHNFNPRCSNNYF